MRPCPGQTLRQAFSSGNFKVLGWRTLCIGGLTTWLPLWLLRSLKWFPSQRMTSKVTQGPALGWPPQSARHGGLGETTWTHLETALRQLLLGQIIKIRDRFRDPNHNQEANRSRKGGSKYSHKFENNQSITLRFLRPLNDRYTMVNSSLKDAKSAIETEIHSMIANMFTHRTATARH